MAYEIPFGLRDLKVYPLTGDAPGTGVDVPRVRTLEYNIERDSADLEGDDVIVATHTFAKKITGSFEQGGVNLAIRVVLEGGTLTTTGVTPNITNTYAVKGTDVEGYFQVIGQSYNDDQGDTHVKLYKCKAVGGPNGSATQGEFGMQTCDIEAVFNGATPSKLLDIIQHESVTAIV